MTKETVNELKAQFQELEGYYQNIGFSTLSAHFRNARILAEEVERQYEMIDKLNAAAQPVEESTQSHEEKAEPAQEDNCEDEETVEKV